MESHSSVEWDLVDYGSGVFHIVSYHENALAVAPGAEKHLEPAAAQESPAVPECLMYRCWVALREGCRAA